MSEIDAAVQLVNLRLQYPLGSEVRRGGRFGIVDGHIVIKGTSAAYVAWRPRSHKARALVVASELVKVSA